MVQVKHALLAHYKPHNEWLKGVLQLDSASAALVDDWNSWDDDE